MKNQNRGFTLIEVMISIAVLAVLIIPILTYFSFASRYSNEGKTNQEAQMTAQSTLEEMESYTSRQQIEALAADSSSGWSVETSSNPYVLKKTMNMNGYDYDVKVTFDYSQYSAVTPAPGNSTSAKYNDYDVPVMQTIYGDNSAVAAEKKENEAAVMDMVNYYVNNKNMTVSEADVKAGMSRTGMLSMMADGDVINVKFYYYYQATVNGIIAPDYSSSFLVNEQVEKTKLSQFVWLYNTFGATEDEIKVDIDSNLLSDMEGNFKFLFLCQNTTVDYNYNLKYTCYSSNNFKFYTNKNIKVDGVPAEYVKEYITSEKQERIADILVEVSDTKSGEVVGTVNSAKSQ